MYLVGVYSTESSTNNAFTVHLYLPVSTADDVVNLLGAQLDAMQAKGAPTSSANITTAMAVDAINDTRASTYLDDDPIASGTYVISPHLETIPHAHIVILPTFSVATYGLALLASRQLRWASTIPLTSTPTWIPDNLR
jgi:hypothetical protein